jgi:hypothetical protein
MEKLRTLTVTDEQLRLIQSALDFYSRIGIGQFTEIKNHPSFESYLDYICTPVKTPEVGDKTPQGLILEIKDGKALIDGSVKNGRWNKAKQWKKLENVKLSTDYSKFHQIRDRADFILTQGRNELIQDWDVGTNGSWGIYNPHVDESCRVAFDLVQVIRHKYWQENPKRSSVTVDSSVHLRTKDSDKIKVD